MAQSIKEELTIKEESIKQEPVKEEFEAESTILESSPQMSASSPPVSPRHVHPLGGRPQPETSLGLPLPPVSATGGLPLSAPSFELPPRPPAQQTERPAKRRRFDFGEEIITVLVGSQEKRYTVHKDVICDTSEFFQTMCTTTSSGNFDGIFRLEDQTEKSFELYVSWIYSKDLDVASDTGARQRRSTKYRVENTQDFLNVLRRLSNAFKLGEALEDMAFRNAVVDEFILLCSDTRRVPNIRAILRLCEQVSMETTFAKAFVDLVATKGDILTIISRDNHWPAEFMLEIARAYVRDRELSLARRGPLNRGRCFYHEHNQGKGRTKFCSS